MSEATQTDRFQVLETDIVDHVLTMKVEVDKDIVSRAYKKVHRALVDRVREPGFRLGRTPLPVLSNFVGKDRFQREVERELLPSFYYDAIRKLDHVPLSRVDLKAEVLSQGQPFVFKAVVPVAPPVEVGDHGELDVSLPAVEEVTEAGIERALLEVRRRAGQLVRSDDEDVIAPGHLVVVSYKGSVEGREYRSISSRTATLRVGDEAIGPELDAVLVGKRVGQAFSTSLTLSEDLREKHLAGKPATLVGEVRSIRGRVEIPFADDAFAQQRGYRDLEALRDRIRDDLEKRVFEQRNEALAERIKVALSRLVVGDLPSRIVEERIADGLESDVQQAQREGMSFEDLLLELGRTEDQHKALAKAEAETDMRIQLALDAIARREGISVSDDDVEEKIRRTAHMLKKDPEEIADLVDSTGSWILQRQELLREKSFRVLMDRFGGSGAS